MMTDTDKDLTNMEQLFTAARVAKVVPSDGMLARILADAADVQAGFQTPRIRPVPRGRLKQLFAVLGGWPAMGGLVTATAVGIWIGVSPPERLSDGFSQVAQAYMGTGDATYLIDIAPGSEFDLDEEAL